MFDRRPCARLTVVYKDVTFSIDRTFFDDGHLLQAGAPESLMTFIERAFIKSSSPAMTK